jgi:hypothetical protein
MIVPSRVVLSLEDKAAPEVVTFSGRALTGTPGDTRAPGTGHRSGGGMAGATMQYSLMRVVLQ